MSVLARAYALTVQCAAHVRRLRTAPEHMPRAISNIQHMRAKPPIRPAAVNPGVIKSRFPKPLTTGALQQGQVKFVTDLLPGSGDLDNFKTRQPQQPTQNTTSTTPTQSGGGTRGSGQTFKEIRCQTGCRGDVVWAVVLVIRVHVFNTE